MPLRACLASYFPAWPGFPALLPHASEATAARRKQTARALSSRVLSPIDFLTTRIVQSPLRSFPSFYTAKLSQNSWNHSLMMPAHYPRRSHDDHALWVRRRKTRPPSRMSVLDSPLAVRRSGVLPRCLSAYFANAMRRTAHYGTTLECLMRTSCNNRQKRSQSCEMLLASAKLLPKGDDTR